jgi:hypothetical protein
VSFFYRLLLFKELMVLLTRFFANANGRLFLLQDFLKSGDFDFIVHGLFKTFFVKNGIFVFPETASAIVTRKKDTI